MSKLTILAATVGILFASSAVAAPKQGKGNSQNSPGQMMRANGPVTGHPGASGYAPGQVKKMKKARDARGYAPRYRTTTGVRVYGR
ncbi:MAG: hypothetical protein Q8M26_08555 [Pseudolabrys sp.]|nr:hypothetical protein [Pseudolabrys sp.]